MILIKEKQYKANLHCHSVLSDGHLTPEELKKIYKAHGYSVLAITDHERPHDHSALSDDDFILITGYEAYIRPGTECKYDLYGPEIHLNLLNKDPHNTDLINWNDKYVKYVKDPVEKAAMHRYGDTSPRTYTVEYINSFIKTANEDGYLVALNHPVWSLEDFSFLFDIDGCYSLEICNTGSYNSGIDDYNGAFYDMLLRRGKRIFTHGADDNHNPTPIDTPQSDSFKAYAMINTEDDSLSYDSIMTSLAKGDFYASMGPEIKYLEVKDNKVYVRCSDAERITMLHGAKSTKKKYAPEYGTYINEAEFEIPEEAKFFRISVYDGKGHYADSRGYFRDEWENA